MEEQIDHRDKNDKPIGTVGIMTFHWAANYGAVLQAWALQRYLQQCGYRTEIIDYVPGNLNISFLRCFRTRHISTMKLRLKEYKKEQLIKEFRRSELNLSAVHYNDKAELKKNPPYYDYYISGSDQIWNPYFTMNGQNGVTLSYYLDFAPENRHRVAFSSSFGCRTLDEKVVEAIQPELAKFEALSTREAEGVSILNEMGLQGVNTADPTILLTADDYKKLISKSQNTSRTVYAYILHGQEDFARPLISYVQNALDCSLCAEDELTVENWLQHIRDAAFVVTNSFHCVVFSLLFHIPFYVIDVKGKDMSSRITTLLGKIGLNDRFLKLPVDVSNIVADELLGFDWAAVDAKLDVIREDARRYLTDSLHKRERIDNVPYSRCTGCGLCSVVCPQKCVNIQEDEHGFFVPCIDENSCIHCGKCAANCIAISKMATKTSYPVTYACWNTDETIRRESSSGGAFSALAQALIKTDGVVYGARYQADMDLRHESATTVEDVNGLRGSKYIPSKAWGAFKEIKDELATGRRVMFVGTPCQVAALTRYIGDSPLLICVDIACHGVPSLKVLRDKCKKISGNKKVGRVDFRNKRSGWKDFSCVYYNEAGQEVYAEIGSESDFMCGYIENLYIRESCEDCQFAGIPRYGDISLADCWFKAHDGSDTDNKGITAVLINTEKGQALFDEARPSLHIEDASLEKILKGTPTLVKGNAHSLKRAQFWNQYNRYGYNTAMSKFFGKDIAKRKILRALKRVR